MYMMISLSHQSIYPINGFLGLQNCLPGLLLPFLLGQNLMSILLFVVLYRVENIQNHIGRRHFHKK